MSHTAELIAVGTELLLGNIANTNAQMLSKELSALGINVFFHTAVGDNPARLHQAVSVAKGRADILITTGGLGPTCDDLTKTVLAEAFGKRLVFHQPSADRIAAFFAALGREMTDNNLQQAMLPEGCTVLDNDWGTAPACAFEADGCHVIMLPGPPAECGPIFRHRVIPYLDRLADGVICSRVLHVFGIGEAALESLLRDRMNAMKNPSLAPYAKEGEVELRITAKAETGDGARALIAPVEASLRALLGHKIYGVDADCLESVCLSLLRQKGLTLGTAESCTGGLIAKRFTDLPGASAVFRGGVVSYSNEVKERALDVPCDLLATHGAVSPQAALAMAQGALRRLDCDLALAVTGVAGPGPDDRGNPVGLVYLALATPEGCCQRTLHVGQTRARVRTMAANYGFDLIRRHLSGLLS
ncbi:MAG: competence/damage-inducible protein A [Clostridiales bacterium]|nr:competence/damage-inducible protein A [Clostridiales bacterium]